MDRDDPQRDTAYRAALLAADKRGVALTAQRTATGWQATAVHLRDGRTVTVHRRTPGQAAWTALLEVGQG